jgi:hypothetical protein
MPQTLTEQEAFEHGFHGLPEPSKRSKMSAEKLAILLSGLEVGSPARILIEHELNLRIAREQSVATWKAALLGAIGGFIFAIMGPVLTAYIQRPETGQREAERREGQEQTKSNVEPKAPPIIQSEAPRKLVQPASSAPPTVKATEASYAASNPKR